MKRITVMALATLLLLGLALAACGAPVPTADSPSAPTAGSPPTPVAASPLPTPTEPPTVAPLPSPTAAPFQLVILHTNDNWGETEPCG